MPSPFPGMDPYLEHPFLWPDVHNALVAELRRRLGPLLRPRYYVQLEERTYLADPDEGLLFVGRPDLSATTLPGSEPSSGGATPRSGGGRVLTVTVPVPEPVRETYLVVRGVDDREVVTVLELLSPSNEVSGDGRRQYETERRSVLASRTNLVELDLLRAGEPMPLVGAPVRSDYRVLVSRGDRRPQRELRAFSVRDRLPAFALPLRPGDVEPEIDLRGALDDVYDTGSYDLRIDYRGEPSPPLSAEDAAWADSVLQAAGRR